jgi:uncharacterized radical SAM protein YgiQ
MFLPTTKEETEKLGWEFLDVILVTGDAYIDSPFIGVAVIGKILLQAGYRVGIIAQPDPSSSADITRLGEPLLFWGVSGGSIDSMVANRTASGKKRKKDDYTPGGMNFRRPDRAVIIYTNLIKSHFKQTKPIVLGGIEASLRRIAHYDFWTDTLRKSILFDSKADYLLYGMADKSIIALAACLRQKQSPATVKGLCYISSEKPDNFLELPSFQEVFTDKKEFTKMFTIFYDNNDPLTACGLAQKHDNRYLIQNPPPDSMTTSELDAVHSLNFERELHPYYARQGTVSALETIRFAITTHRGCYGECNFCAIALHQGRTVQSRSKQSILKEAEKLTRHPYFKGTIHDVGGPTANMYGFECQTKLKKGSCRKKRCLFPKICDNLPLQHEAQISLLQDLRKIKKIKKIFIASGIRYDMILADKNFGQKYLREIIQHHISGQMKIAPEHSVQQVLLRMGKPMAETLLQFRKLFQSISQQEKKKQFLTYYMIAAHPGCTLSDMSKLKAFALKHLQLLPKQVQIFTPTPSTFSTLMYYTSQDPFSGENCYVEKTFQGREKQKNVILEKKIDKAKTTAQYKKNPA